MGLVFYVGDFLVWTLILLLGLFFALLLTVSVLLLLLALFVRLALLVLPRVVLGLVAHGRLPWLPKIYPCGRNVSHQRLCPCQRRVCTPCRSY